MTTNPRRGRSLALATIAAALAAIAAEPAAAGHGPVTAVNGGAFGYYLGVSVFGPPMATRGPGPTVTLASDAANSPLSASAPTASAVVGAATFFTSGALNVNAQATIGPGGSVSSSATVANVNTSGQEALTATGVASTCSASASGSAGSTTITGGTLMTDNGLDINSDGDYGDGGEHPPVTVAVPANPVINTSYAGHIHTSPTAQDTFAYLFNEHLTDHDGTLVVYAAHQRFIGPAAIGDLFIGKAQCDVTFTPHGLAPVNSSPPTISGSATQGQTLTTARGSWTNAATGFSYQWLSCDGAGAGCAPIAGATAQSHTLTAADVGRTVRVQETAHNSDGPGSPSTSAPTGLVQPATGTPPPAPPPAVVPPPVVAVPTTAQIRALLLTSLRPTGRAAHIGAILKAGGYSLTFRAPGAASLIVEWFALRGTPSKSVRVASGRRSFSAAGTAKLNIKLNAAGRRLLARSRRLRLTAKASFTRPGSAPVRASRTFTLRR